MRTSVAVLTVVVLAATGLTAVASAQPTETQVDYVDIGIPASETGHSLDGWGPVVPPPGNWGGIDDCRATWSPDESPPIESWASFTLQTGDGLTATRLELTILDGIADDSFEVYVNNSLVESYTDVEPINDPETWYTRNIGIASLGATGTLTVRIDSTGPQWDQWGTYGQLGVDEATLFAEQAPEDEGCFIATAACGPEDDNVNVLRAFRDDFLETSTAGKGFVSAYYRISPPIADFIDDHPSVKPAVRTALLPAVGLSDAALSTSLAGRIAAAVMMLAASGMAAVWLKRKAAAQKA